MANFRDFTETLAPIWAQIPDLFGQRLTGFTALLHDLIAEGMSQAVRSPWLGRTDQPDDALGFIGIERLLPKYTLETLASYRTTLQNAWTIWEAGGNPATIESMISRLGFTGTVYETQGSANVWTRGPSPYWSQFWLWVEKGEITTGAAAAYADPGLTYGADGVGSGATYGSGLSNTFVSEVRDVLNRFRPAHVICREIVIELTGESYGTGHDYADPGLVYGGTNLEIGC